MKIAILGSGNMGRALGMRWAQNGHEVFFGGRNPAKAAEVAAFVGNGVRSGSLNEAAAFGDVLLHTARDAMLSSMIEPTVDLAGKVVIDLNNGPIPEGFAYTPIEQSFTERLQEDAPDTQVVKAFNLFAMEMFEHEPAVIAQHDVSAFVAGDSEPAKVVVAKLAAELGFTPVDAGGSRNARMLEGMGDFIRYLMIEQKLGPFTSISAHGLPVTERRSLGGRAASNFG
ncbi:MAG: NAD(P)-binding domain-containing protein [Pseudomonadota bacterium]